MTQTLGIIGDPVAHSLSPAMQRAALKSAGIDAVYQAFHVLPDKIATFIEEARATPYLGFNITIPHKQIIMAHLDEIQPEAAAIGAVNTVLNRDGRLIGFNTDGIGYLRSLTEEKNWQPTGKVATLLGAGGAARAVAYALLDSGLSTLFIVNRTPQKAEALAKDLNKMFAGKIRSGGWEILESCLSQSELLINATSVGMDDTSFQDLHLEALPKGALVSDLVYTPRITPLLKTAQSQGYDTHEGLGMLLYQGAEAFKIWFNQDPDIEIMRKVLEEKLKKT